MWKLCRLMVCGILGCCLTAAGAAGAAPESKAESKAGAEQDEMMAAMAKLATPGPQHAVLKPLVGSWKTVTKAWMGPGEPQVSEGSSEVTWVLGGRFVTEEYKGTFMGKPFEGMGLFGYDNQHKEYVSTWADIMGTSITMSKGRADDGGKTLTYASMFDDPMTGQKKPFKMVTKIIDDNNHTFSMFEDVNGKETMTMEITYTRK